MPVADRLALITLTAALDVPGVIGAYRDGSVQALTAGVRLRGATVSTLPGGRHAVTLYLLARSGDHVRLHDLVRSAALAAVRDARLQNHLDRVGVTFFGLAAPATDGRRC